MGGGWLAQRRVGDFDDIDDWMAQRNADLALRQEADAVGRDLWDQATRDGQDLVAAQPGDLIAIGANALNQNGQRVRPPDPAGEPASGYGDDETSPQPTASAMAGGLPSPVSDQSDSATPSYQFAMARPGDSISRLVGTSDPGAIGRFASRNGLNGRSSTLYAGRSYAVPTRFDDASPAEIATGNRLLQGDNARMAAARARAANDSTDDRLAERFNAGLNPWTGEPPEAAPADPAQAPAYSWLDRSKTAKAVAGAAALFAGVPVGIARGASQMGAGIADGLTFLTRLADPHDAENHLPGESAWDGVSDAGRGVLDYAKTGVSNPRGVVGDVGNVLRHARASFDPFATPMADTLSGEMSRAFGIGENLGEGGFDLGTLWDGGELVAGLRVLGAASEEAKIAKYIRPGASPAYTAHMAELYDGRGSHFVPRRAKFPESVFGMPLPEAVAGKPLPRAFIDSAFNVSKPANMSRAEFYAYHYAVDPRFYGARLPADLDGGRGWSGQRLGLKRYNRVGRLWHGAPLPLKAAVGGASAGAALGAYDSLGNEAPQ